MTNWTNSLTVGENTGNSQTDTRGYVKLIKQVSVGGGSGAAGVLRAIVTLPPKTTILALGAVNTSAPAGVADVTALKYSFGTSGDVDQLGLIVCSAASNLRYIVPVSGSTDFDDGGTVIISVSAENTSVFTGGGGRAFIEYLTVKTE